VTLGKLFLGAGQESLTDRLANRDNHFNFVRLLLASMVMIDHAGLVVSGMAGSEPFRPFGVSLGYMAVDGFFILSGLLIARSLATKGVGAQYFLARLLRVYPALIFLAVIAVFLIGPIIAQESYWRGWATISYGIEIIKFGDTSGGPIGFYPDNPFPNEFNSPLWTLRYEMLCYVLAPFAFWLGIISHRFRFLICLVLLGGVSVIFDAHEKSIFGSHVLASCVRLGFAFGIGIGLWHIRNLVRGQFGWLVLGLGVFMIAGVFDVGQDVADTVFMATFVMWLGLANWPALSKLPLKSDISYGVYIYHYPIMQILIANFPDLSWPRLLLFSTILTLPAAWVSWTFIEKTALRYKKGFRANGKTKSVAS